MLIFGSPVRGALFENSKRLGRGVNTCYLDFSSCEPYFQELKIKNKQMR